MTVIIVHFYHIEKNKLHILIIFGAPLEKNSSVLCHMKMYKSLFEREWFEYGAIWTDTMCDFLL